MSLELRGDTGSGWGMAHRLCCWARIGDGERAYAILGQYMAPASRLDRVFFEGYRIARSFA